MIGPLVEIVIDTLVPHDFAASELYARAEALCGELARIYPLAGDGAPPRAPKSAERPAAAEIALGRDLSETSRGVTSALNDAVHAEQQK